MNELIEYVVVGSGPAGWSTSMALIEKGITPTVIDIGLTEFKNDPNFFIPGGIKNGISTKTNFGSRHMYQYPSQRSTAFDSVGQLPISGAFGGLSTVWGANLQGCLEACRINSEDELIEVQNAFNFVLGQIPHCGKSDRLDQVFPWPKDFVDETPQSQRMEKMCLNYQQHSDEYSFLLGMARNASAGLKTGCIGCAECMNGCPANVIFSTKSSFQEMISSSKVKYKKGIVSSIHPTDRGWTISIEDSENQTIEQIDAINVYLAAGSIATSILLSRSQLIPDEVTLQDTQVFYLPMVSRMDKEPLTNVYSLSQVFVSSKDVQHGPSSFHLSLYENGKDWRDRLQKKYGVVARVIPRKATKLLVAAIGFLPSSESGRISIKRQNGIQVSLQPRKNQKKLVRNLIRKLRPDLLRLGLFPVNKFTEIPSCGSSFHVGVLESEHGKIINNLGMINGKNNLFITDGCALNVLPTGPVTLSIMANARHLTLKSVDRR